MHHSTAIVLAGGRATRLGGVNKAMLPVAGEPVLHRVLAAVRAVADQIIVVGHLVAEDIAPDVEVVSDLVPGGGSLGGIYTGLVRARFDLAVTVGCDMPFLSAPLLSRLIFEAQGYDAAVPRIGPHLEALHAVYRRSCLPIFKEALDRGELKIIDCYPRIRLREVPESELRQVDPELHSFLNINTPADLEKAVNLASRS